MDQKLKKTLSGSVIAALLLAAVLIVIRIARHGESSQADSKWVTAMTNDSFKKLVFDYTSKHDWKYTGTKPALIDFYATWCGPCKKMSPMLEELAKEYEGKIIVYKVDTDREQELTNGVGIASLPTILFIPLDGKPRVSMGLISKEALEKAVKEILPAETK
jgi:thioredoxin 1